MAQHDYILESQAGAAFRSDLNDALQAIVSNNSGATEPSVTYAYQWWADTSAGILKRRNAADDGWIEVMPLTLAMSALGITLAGAASASVARSALGVAPMSAVKGLTGNVNSTTPLTKYDLSATAVVLQDANGATVLRQNTGTLTCDLGLAGSVANGRDQAGAFTANNWIYLYFIWNGTTLATLASTTAPASFTGSPLPTGYTHWAFATALRWNASSNIIPAFAEGSRVIYDLQTNAANRVLNGGTASVMTTLDCSSVVPPISRVAYLQAILAAGSAVGLYDIKIQTPGSSHTGVVVQRIGTEVASSLAQSCGGVTAKLSATQNINYLVSSGATASLDVIEYIVPNGDA